MNQHIEWASLSAGTHRLHCPACGRERRSDKTLGVTVDAAGAGVGHCFRCAYVETYRPGADSQPRRSARHHEKVQPVAEPPKAETLSAEGRALWHTAHPILAGTPAADYLRLRRCHLPPQAGHLRWLPAYRHPSGHVGPCLLALLTDALTSEARSLHFTWIDGGRKAAIDGPRRLYARHRKAGAVCRLWPLEKAAPALGIAEGIETALSLAHGFSPVWACIDAGNLAAFPVLPDVETLVIAQDRDPAGERAAAECAKRWAGAGREVFVTRQAVNDLNDLVQAVAA